MADHFFKYKNLYSSTLSTGIGTGTGETITPASVSGVPTDTPVTIIIDRVDSSGTATPSKMEGIRGTISGGNLTSYTRAVVGTEQAHTAGAVVEMVWNAADLNELIDGILIEHNQDGTHKSALVTTLKASGAVVTTGTSDVTIVTPKAVADALIPNGKQIATPANPSAGYDKLYFKSDDKLYKLTSGGVETEIGAGDLTATSTTTLTNKRIEPRIVTAASYTTDTGTSLDVSTADVFQVTAQAGALKFNNPGGTPVAGQKLIVRIKDNGTASALTYDTQFRASSDLALPTTTVINKTLYMGFIFNATDTKWDLLAVLNNF